MDNSVDPNDPSYEYQALTSPTSMDHKFNHPDSVGNSHESIFGGNFPFGFPPFDTIEPATLQLSHTSHDDSCVDACPGIYNSQGLPRGSYPAATHVRSRFATSSCSYPFASPESPIFPNTTQYYDQMCSILSADLDLRYPANLGGKYLHQPTTSGQQFSTPVITAGFCPISHCGEQADAASRNCSGNSCSDACCSTVCNDEACEDQGIPCDSPACLDGDSASSVCYPWDIHPHDWNFPQYPVNDSSAHESSSYNHPCNHTNTEHDVAITLRHLKEPGTASQPPNPVFNSFECPVFGHLEHTTELPKTERSVSDTSPLISDKNIASPTSARPNVSIACTHEENTKEHICNWIIKGTQAKPDQICGQIFNNNEDLHHHLGKVHVTEMSSKTKYLCMWHGCSRLDEQNFASRNKLRRHISTHTSFKPFKCDHCGEGFSAQQALDQHIRTHTGEKPYKCDEPGCGKAFKQKSALTMHKRTHTGEKPLTCEYCGKSFCESSNLSKHRKIHLNDKKFECDVCGRQFIRIDQLRRHSMKHIRDKDKGKARLRQSMPPGKRTDMDTDSMSYSIPIYR